VAPAEAGRATGEGWWRRRGAGRPQREGRRWRREPVAGNGGGVGCGRPAEGRFAQTGGRRAEPAAKGRRRRGRFGGATGAEASVWIGGDNGCPPLVSARRLRYWSRIADWYRSGVRRRQAGADPFGVGTHRSARRSASVGGRRRQRLDRFGVFRERTASARRRADPVRGVGRRHAG